MGNPQQFDLDRVIAKVKRLCYAGLEAERLRYEVMQVLHPVLPSDLFCFDTVDPSTGLVTSSVQKGIDSREVERTYLEHVYFEDTLCMLQGMLRQGIRSARLSERTDGKLERALRYRLLYGPMGLGDEISAVLTSGGQMWGSLIMASSANAPFYSDRQEIALARLAPHLGQGLRAATLRLIAQMPQPNATTVPGLIIYHQKGFVESNTPAAEHWLAELGQARPNWQRNAIPPVVLQISGLLRRATAMRTEAEEEIVPQLIMVGRTGTTITVKAFFVESRDGTSRIGILLEPSSARELVRLRTTAFSLTSQEDTVVHLVARGASTKIMAEKLGISPYTVQEHLTNIFDKVGVRSRREMVKQIFLTNLFGDDSAVRS